MDARADNPDQATVLIVDDDPGARLLLGTALELAGFRIATAADGVKGDIGVGGGRVVALGERLDKGRREVDATGLIAVPGGIDAHTHLDMPFGGTTSSDDFETGTRAAAIGGTTTIVDFAIQAKGTKMRAALDTWWKKARVQSPDLLTFTQADLVGPAADGVDPADYPSSWGGGLPLSYEFAPGQPEDGVTADVPLPALGQVTGEELGWQVPGRREELVTELIRSLPKELRRLFVPAPDTARAVTARLGEPRGDLRDALASEAKAAQRPELAD